GTFNQEFYKTTPLIGFEGAKQKINEYIQTYNYSRLHSSLYYLTPIDFMENRIDEKLKCRENKLKNAAKNRTEY
ncbi:MAG: transposase, partial [Arcobacter sp.]|nr:transposase [Arcobacter sp.]